MLVFGIYFKMLNFKKWWNVEKKIFCVNWIREIYFNIYFLNIFFEFCNFLNVKKIVLLFDIVVFFLRFFIFKDKGYVIEICRFVKNIIKNLIILDDVGFIFFK